MSRNVFCPECDAADNPVNRREFVRVIGSAAVAAAAATAVPLSAGPVLADDKSQPAPETNVKKLYDSLTPAQKDDICFEWDFSDDRGVLRTHVSNNWNITDVWVNVADDSSLKLNAKG